MIYRNQRQIKTLAVQLTAALVAWGCGADTARDEETGSTEQAVVNCKADYKRVCELNSLGHPVCECDLNVVHSHAFPAFQVLQISYAAPGNASEVDYAAGGYTGSSVQYQTTTSVGVDVSTDLGAGAEDKFQWQHIQGNGNASQTTNTEGITVGANLLDDTVNHQKDIFFVWTNPEITMSRTLDTGADGYVLSSNGPQIVEMVTAAELSGAETIPSWNTVSNLDAASRQAILNLDPFFGGLNLGTSRYQWLKKLDLTGPDHPGDHFVAHTFDLAVDVSHNTSMGTGYDDELTLGFEENFIIQKVKLAVDFEYQYQAITTTTNGQQTDATIKLGTTNACVHAGYDVYLDKAFNSYLTIPSDTMSNGAASGYSCCDYSPHSLCEQGVPLDESCQADSCQSTVCYYDSYCCENYWDDICVEEASAWCGVCG